MAGVEKKDLDIVQNPKEQEQLQAKNDILQSVKNYADKLQDKQKAELIKQLAPKVLNAMQREGFILENKYQKLKIDMKDIRDSKKDGKNILEIALFRLPNNYLKGFNIGLTPGNPKYKKRVGQFKTLLEQANFVADKEVVVNKSVADLNQTADGNIDEIGSAEAKLVQATTRAETALKTKFSDQFANTENIDGKTDQELIQIAQDKFNVNLSEIQKKIETSNYKGNLTISQVFSFLQTKQIAKQSTEISQDPDYQVFDKNFSQIQNDLDLYILIYNDPQ